MAHTRSPQDAPPTWLVGHDLTPRADDVALAAADELSRSGGRLILFHAYQVPTRPPVYAGATIGTATMPMELDREVSRMAQRRLERVSERIAERYPSVRVEVRVTQGQPASSLLEAADAERVSRIVVGTHGRTGFRHLLLGSVAERVVRLAAVPVLVVKLPEPEAGGAEAADQAGGVA